MEHCFLNAPSPCYWGTEDNLQVWRETWGPGWAGCIFQQVGKGTWIKWDANRDWKICRRKLTRMWGKGKDRKWEKKNKSKIKENENRIESPIKRESNRGGRGERIQEMSVLVLKPSSQGQGWASFPWLRRLGWLTLAKSVITSPACAYWPLTNTILLASFWRRLESSLSSEKAVMISFTLGSRDW